MSDHYILKGREVVPCDLMTWARAFEDRESRRIARDVVGDVKVSTVFLGLNHTWGAGDPEIFETMVFGGPMDEHCERCSTYDQAEAQHARILAEVRAKENSSDTPQSETSAREITTGEDQKT